jgi:hypothetical protein
MDDIFDELSRSLADYWTCHFSIEVNESSNYFGPVSCHGNFEYYHFCMARIEKAQSIKC